MTNRYTGRKQVIKTKDFVELLKIAGLTTKEDLEYLFREEEE